MAKATFIQSGDNIDYTPASDTEYMEIVPLTDRIGIALENIAKSETGTVTLTGVFELPAATGSALTVGQKVYFDKSKNQITATAEGNIYAGYTVAPKAAAAASARVRIG